MTLIKTVVIYLALLTIAIMQLNAQNNKPDNSEQIVATLLFTNEVIESAMKDSINFENDDKPNIAFLSTFHFAGSTDALSLKIDDLSTKERQDEIKSLV